MGTFALNLLNCLVVYPQIISPSANESLRFVGTRPMDLAWVLGIPFIPL